MFCRKNKKCDSIKSVGPGCKYRDLQVNFIVIKLKVYFCASTGANPVTLNCQNSFRPAIEQFHIIKKSTSVIGYFKEPLRQDPSSYRTVTSFALSGNNLLVCKYGLAGITPVYRSFFLFGKPHFVK